jgi:hypothetical protein
MCIRRGDRWIFPILAIPAAIALGAAAGADVNLKGFERVAEIDVPLTGREVALELPRGAKPQDIRVVLAGAFKCSYDGSSYDALRATSGSDEFDREHGYVEWSPAGMELADSDVSTHQYVLRLPKNTRELPASVSAWIDVDQFVTDLIITPSNVRQSLSGNLRLEVWRARRSSPAGPMAVVGLLALGVLAVVLVRRRNRPPVEMADVAEHLRRIDRKYDSAVGTIEGQREDTFELSSELERLRDGSRELARHIEAFRGAARTVDRRQLDAEIARMEGQLAEAERDDVRQEIEATLTAKCKLRDLLADTDANEARYLLRLSKIESTIDATTMWVTGQEQRLADEVGEDRAIAEIEEELKSLDQAIEELKVVD